MLLVNRHNGILNVSIPGTSGGQLDYVDASTGSQAPGSIRLTSDHLAVQSFSVAVLTLP